MIVRTKRPARILAIDTVLTASAWLAFLYLFTKGMVVITFGSRAAQMFPMLDIELSPTSTALVVYLLACAANGTVIVLWAKMGGASKDKARRLQSTDQRLTRDGIADRFHLSRDQVDQVQDSRVTVIYHSPVGGITHLETDRLQLEEARTVIPQQRVRAA